MNEDRVAFYERLIEAEQRLDRLRARAGVSERDLDRALAPNDNGDPDDLYRLARAVELLGGRLEIRAVFSDDAVTLLLEPEPTGGS